MTEALRLPKPDDLTRVESGVVQFGDDWPGIFLRGDDALFLALACQQAAEATPDEHWPLRAQLAGFAETLRSCSVGDTGWPPLNANDVQAATAVIERWTKQFMARKAELIEQGRTPEEADEIASAETRREIREGR